ncbi:hypothetical protein [Streptomyces californicus]|uniref:hypothetical protein n=1 Tax=Streptomyces californicus TaxID=67351 RepID=UPI0004C0443E|nr:hypothetical protein [Streptomyces californicus]QRV59430.1 hypothetical protein I6J40_34795 [Streptomyces californicus]
MTTIVPTADTALAKARLTRDWYDSGAGRHADLTDWVQSTTPDGLPMMSARLSAPLCAEVWAVFAARQEATVALRSGAGDVLPALDYSVPDRTGCVWREDGVWVEVWHPNTPEASAPRPGPPVVFRAPATNDLPGFGCTLTITAHPDQAEPSTPSAPLPRRPANRFRRTPKDTAP